jgi:hypothetical protein
MNDSPLARPGRIHPARFGGRGVGAVAVAVAVIWTFGLVGCQGASPAPKSPAGGVATTPTTSPVPTVSAGGIAPSATPTGTSPVSTPGLTAGPTLTPAPTPVAGTFTTTGSMGQARWFHTATLLKNGLVLIAGGASGDAAASAELYNPATGTFSPTGDMKVARSHHTATLLEDGRVLITGGVNAALAVLASAEIYNPSTGTFALTNPLITGRAYHTATLLPNGTVLIVGGRNAAGRYLQTAETYSSTIGRFSSTGGLQYARGWHTATSLADGRVLVAGGANSSGVLASAEVYSGGMFTLAGWMYQGRGGAAASLMPNGDVLVSAGYAYCPGVSQIPSGMACIDTGLTTAELFHPGPDVFTRTVGPLAVGRGAATLTMASAVLPDGRVLVPGGGLHNGSSIASAELYNPTTGVFIAAGSMNDARSCHTVTRLPNGKILVTGGYDGDSGSILATAELFSV